MRGDVVGAVPTPDQAQHSVEFLCHRFSNLFAQLHREEADLKSAVARNELLEQRLLELRRREGEQSNAGRAEVDGRMAEVIELRRELEAEERRTAVGGDEANALVVAASTYTRQAERLRERWREEQHRERAAECAATRQREELLDLRKRKTELCTELDSAEAGCARVTEELRLVKDGTAQTLRDIAFLEHRLHEERTKCESSESNVRVQREELQQLEHKVGRSGADCDDISRRLDGQLAEGREHEEKVMLHAERRAECQDELNILHSQLRERRREGSDGLAKLAEHTREVMRGRERLETELRLHRQEQEASQAVGARLEQLRLELPAAERDLRDAEAEVGLLRRRGADVEERCAAQRSWCEELKQRREASEFSIERLREELRLLGAKRMRLQQEVDEATQERTRLEVELEVTTPVLQDVWRRCRELEERLAARVQELGLEMEKARRCRVEAAAARARVGMLERHNETIGVKLREFRVLEQAGGVGDVGGNLHRAPSADSNSYHYPRSGRRDQSCERAVSPARPWGLQPPLLQAGAQSQPRNERRVHFVPGVGMDAVSSVARHGRPRSWDRHLPNPVPPALLLGGPGSPTSSCMRSPGRLSPTSPGRWRGASSADGGLASSMQGGVGGKSGAADNFLGYPAAIAGVTGAGAIHGGRGSDCLHGTSVVGGFGGSTPGRQVDCNNGNQDDAVRFLCEFVAREEERLGLTPRTSAVPREAPYTPPLATTASSLGFGASTPLRGPA
mmetsp:Transcript_13340/g.35793  ORF Transcript_13340/g.35793 Transcript_13340/m.35793 type:complete len:741 (+) Transcript_13340:113-2335(+)